MKINKYIINMTSKSLHITTDMWNFDTDDNIICEENTINNSCPSCKKEKFTKEDGYQICTNCGYQLDQIIDETQEWKNYSNNDKSVGDQSRCGIPNVNIPSNNLSTIVLGNVNGKLQKMSTWNLVKNNEKSCIKSYNTINEYANKIGLNRKLIDKSCTLYYEINNSNTNRGKPRNGLILACIYTACKIDGNKISKKDLSKKVGISQAKISGGCKQYNEILTSINKKNIIDEIKKKSKKNTISKLMHNFDISQNHKTKIKNIKNTIKQLGIIGENNNDLLTSIVVYHYCKKYDINISYDNYIEYTGYTSVIFKKNYKNIKLYDVLF